MAFKKKTPLEKLKTRITNLLANGAATKSGTKIKINNKVLFEYNSTSIKYGFTRFFETRKDAFVNEDYKVTIPLTDENLKILGANLLNPPRGARIIYDLFKKNSNKDFNHVIIGSDNDNIENDEIHVTKNTYDTLIKINKEEGLDKVVRFRNRAAPFLRSNFNFKIKEQNSERDYSLLLQEIIASGEISQKDILTMTDNLDEGENTNIVITHQVNKQAEWLIAGIEEILGFGELSRASAKELGNKLFSFSKSEISGPEHLMEKILSKYGQYPIFGVPVLLNTKKYVVHKAGLSRSQFDIILINHLSDVEVVELKRPDTLVLEYDEGRGKFYASKDLSIAISQAERYISAVYRDNDEEYKIGDKKIREFINEQIGGSMTVEITRPTALIVIGSYLSIAKDYSELSDKTKRKVTNDNYINNYFQAYKELRGAHKNINILTYSELVESARTKLLLSKAQAAS